jgi:hypothetical protein
MEQQRTETKTATWPTLAKADGIAATDMAGGTPRPRLKRNPKKT